MSTEFKVGDVVQLKSGGPLMTVISAGAADVNVVWFGSGLASLEARFPVACLVVKPYTEWSVKTPMIRPEG